MGGAVWLGIVVFVLVLLCAYRFCSASIQNGILQGWQRTRMVSATATAEATSIFGSCPYAMFAGQRIEESGTGISISGNNIQINGNIHSNSDISMQHAVLSPGCVATAVRTVNPTANSWTGNSIALDMPSFRSFEKAMSGMPGYVVISGDVVGKKDAGFAELLETAATQYTAQGGSLNTLYARGLCIHITGSLTFLGNNATTYYADYPITLVVDGSIDLNGAPLNSSDACFVGRIVAQNIRKTGGKITVTYRENVDRFLPTTKVHLIA